MVDLKAVEEVSNSFANDTTLLARELKKVQSTKCRLKKMKGRKDYDTKMTATLQYEELLKEARQLLEPKTKAVTQFEQSDVDLLDYDETIKAIRSIQSKKTLSKWLTGVEGDNDEYRNAVRIESMLVARRDATKPVDNDHLRKSDLLAVIETIESSGKLTTARVLELLNELL